MVWSNQFTKAALGLSLFLSMTSCAVDVAEPEAGAELEQGIGSASLVVMSVNVRIPDDTGERAWDRRLPRIRDMVNSTFPSGPHLIGLQELRGWTRDQLTAALPQYWWYTVDRGDGEMIGIFVRTDRLTVLDYGYRDVSNGARDDSCGLSDDEDPKNRPIQYVLVRDKTTNKQSYFYNTHYPSKNSCERYGMSNIFASYVAARAQPSARAILVGDFNDGINADYSKNGSFQRLLDRTGYTAAFLQGPRTPPIIGNNFLTGNSFNKEARVGKIIDHVLVSNASDVFEMGIDRSMFRRTNGARVSCFTVTNGRCNENTVPVADLELYSDHWAVWASLRQ
ncbi:MAG TPA: endonuclease/exonuclease/phosphatase family protein [Polyangiaceae bacterium]|nr:endonuclease/exonuclease/phosphatase family protein [Polyangiaceae bacterium]